jgi:hypothetical protein
VTKRRIQKVFLVLSLTCAAICDAFAQATWNDLSFGSSLSEVRQALAKQDSTLERSDVPWIVKPGWDFKSPGVKIALHFTPLLYFSDADKLDRISLQLKGAKSSITMYEAVTSMHEQLIRKYGKPVIENNTCISASVTDFVNNPHEMDCQAGWRADKQDVTLSWTYYGEDPGNGKLSLSIAYVPVEIGGL